MDQRLPGSPLCRLHRDAGGAAIIEFAIVLPVLLALIMGIVSYGDWFLTAHGVQQAANDGARAAIGGMSAAEREALADTATQTSLRRAGMLDPAHLITTVDDDGSTLVVRLSYDASADPLLHLSFAHAPGTTIQRSAAIRLDSL
ncbi:MAG TPA: TadE/TadG family type IV pilus assembly protein [Sphingomonas sp.]